MSIASVTRPKTASPVPERLAPLELRLLQRPRLFLSTDGFHCSLSTLSSGSAPVIGLEEIVQIQEQSPIKSPPRSELEAALRLTILPKKCASDDEVALMPCHSFAHRGFPELEAERWREPLRDRDTLWLRDELARILSGADAAAARRRRGLGMTLAPSPANRGKWRRWEAQKLCLSVSNTADGSSSSSPVRRQRAQPSGVLLRNYGVMISNTYCLVSIYGVGLVGRLYDAGVSQREQLSVEGIKSAVAGADDSESVVDTAPEAQQKRFLRVEAYDPGSSRVFSLRVTLKDLAWAFHERPEFLIAGKKLALLRELVALLFFEYPTVEDGDRQPSDSLTSNQSDSVAPPGRTATPETDAKLSKRKGKLPVLRLAQERRLSEAARRRMEREARLRWEEEQRLLALAAFLKLPRRARHRLACKCVRLSGRSFLVSVYQLPAQARSFAVIAYHPRSSASFHLAVSVSEVAALAKVLSLPHTWSTDQRRSLAESLVPRLHFRGSRVPSVYLAEGSTDHGDGAYGGYRAALAVQEDRQGPWAAPGWLPPLERPQTDEMVRAELAEKRQRDTVRALELTASNERESVRQRASQRASELEKQLSELEARRMALLERDAALVKQIEEIDSRGSAAAVATDPQASDPNGASPSKVHHELRRAHKAARKALKVEQKALNAQVADKKRELQVVLEQAQLDLNKLQRRLKRKLQALTEDAMVATASNAALVAAGACKVEGSRLRYSLFALSDATDGDISSLRLELYESIASQSASLEISRLDCLALTKAASHEQQLRVPDLAVGTSSVLQRVREIDAQLVELQRELAVLSPDACVVGQATSSRKASTVAAKTAARRQELMTAFAALSRERRGYSRRAPWDAVVRGLCDRLRLVRGAPNTAIGRLEIDRCLFRASLPIISLTDDENESDAADGDSLDDQESLAPVMSAIARRSSTSAGADDGLVVYCDVRAVLSQEELQFEVFEPLGRQTWHLTYPDSLELVKEFASNTFMEQQLHVEAIAMTLVFFVSPRSGRAKLRFEE